MFAKLILFRLSAFALCHFALISAAIVLIFVHSLISRVFPWADEWLMLFPDETSFGSTIKWFLSYHNDHLVLIPRLLQIPASTLVGVIGAVAPMAARRRFAFGTGKTIVGRYRFSVRQHHKWNSSENVDKNGGRNSCGSS